MRGKARHSLWATERVREFAPALHPALDPIFGRANMEGCAMRTSYYRNARGGHCPGHVRDTFGDAVYTYADWAEGDPEPTVEFEVRYVPRQIPISKACGLVWNCSDILPGSLVTVLEDTGLELKRFTYAAAARAIHAAILEQRGGDE
jgi:hypothetical protein